MPYRRDGWPSQDILRRVQSHLTQRRSDFAHLTRRDVDTGEDTTTRLIQLVLLFLTNLRSVQSYEGNRNHAVGLAPEVPLCKRCYHDFYRRSKMEDAAEDEVCEA